MSQTILRFSATVLSYVALFIPTVSSGFMLPRAWSLVVTGISMMLAMMAQ